MQAMSTRNSTRGFTIVELTVVLSILGILIALVLNTLGDFYQSNTTSLSQTVQSTDTRGVLRTIETDLTNASSFLPQTTMTPVNPTGSDNNAAAWDFKGDGTNRVLIASAYATTKPANDDTRSLVYLNTGGVCDAASSTPMQYNLVYFIKQDANGQNNLYRRTMIPTNTQCPAPLGPAVQKQTCQAAKLALGTFSNCQAADAALLYNVSNFTVTYYDTAVGSNEINYATGDITTAKSIRVKVTTVRRVNGVNQPYSSEIRISKLN